MSHEDRFGWTGSVLDGKYRIEAVVGQGGFSVVYRAQHLGFGEPVAVKCLKLPPGLRPEARAQFERSFLEEGRHLHRLSRATAGIVQALDVGTATSPIGAWTPYLVLEWLDGMTLEDDLADRAARGAGGRSIDEAMALLGPAARALDVAHDHGIAHRDVKPGNVFLAHVGGTRAVKILDFGIAKVMSETSSLAHAHDQTGRSVQAFSAGYGAPEQFDRSHGATGPWTDVFAFALLLVEVLSGAPALRGSDTVQLYVQASDPRRRPSPRERGVPVSDAVEAVFQRALAVDPKDRHPRLGAMWDALVAAIRQDRPVEPSVAPSRRGMPAGRSAPWLAATALVALGAVGVVAASTSDDEGDATAPATRVEHVLPGAAAPVSPPDGMVAVAPATFVMGSDDGTAFERPAHPVTVARGFFLDRTEVTVAAYGRCVAAGACTSSGVTVDDDAAAGERSARPCNAAHADRGDHPINCVSQPQAVAYCRFVGKRLPTEAEWELAARGADGRRYPWGGAEPTCDRAVSAGCRDGAHDRAGTRPAGGRPGGRSPSGAVDLAGNVWEWVEDTWSSDAYARTAGAVDPVQRAAPGHGVLRGGAWDVAATHVTSTTRTRALLGSAHASTGFRCARTAGGEAPPVR